MGKSSTVEHLPPKSGVGRRQKDSGAREVILQVAQQHFAQRGYEGTSIRTLAAQVGVDPALIRHYFGSKEQLFSAVLSLPLDAYAELNSAFGSGGQEQMRHFLSVYFSLWENDRTATPLLTMLRSAMDSPTAMQSLRDFLAARLRDTPAPPLVTYWERTQLLIASQLIGIALTRYLLKIEPLASLNRKELIDLLAPVLEKQLWKEKMQP